MQYVSTRGKSPAVNFSTAIAEGLAPDGGLYVPRQMPLRQVVWQPNYAAFAADLLQDFLAEDPLLPDIEDVCAQSFHFQPEVMSFAYHRYCMQLFTGPTLSFKDYGAQFIAQCMARQEADKKRLLLVATSGDTGSAVAAAFHQKPNIDVVILYPKGLVSDRQAHQLSCWDNNVTTLAVEATFDDCQRLVKSAFNSPEIADNFALTTANSINIGRLLPQVVYYAYVSQQCAKAHQQLTNFIVPSGNLGNVTAAHWAREMGYPVGKIVCAQNQNDSLVRLIESGRYQPKDSVATLANAMDVGAPSNLERLQYLYPEHTQFCEHVSAFRITDELIQEAIGKAHQDHQLILCPHTATAYSVLTRHFDGDDGVWVVVETAHPSKFDDIVSPIIQVSVPLPDRFYEQLSRRRLDRAISPTMASVISEITIDCG